MPFKFEKNPFNRTQQEPYRVYMNSCDEYNTDKLEPYLQKTDPRVYIFSDSGVFLSNDGLYRIQYVDKAVEERTVVHDDKSYTFIIDKSIESIGEQAFQIPITHAAKTLTYYTYAFVKKSPIKLLIIKEGTEIVDIYFELMDDLDHVFVKADLFSFLSLLN